MQRKIDDWWHADFYFDDRRYRKKAPLNTKGAAEELERFLVHKLLRGESLQAPKTIQEPTFGEFTKTWYKTYVQTNNKPSEQFQKDSILRRHLVPYFGKLLLSEIDSARIEGYKSLKKAQVSDKTVNNHLAILSKCLRSANEWGQLKIVPKFKGLKTNSQRLDHLSPKEIESLLSYTQESQRNGMILLALHTGMRPGELTALRWEDIDLAQRIITVRHSMWKNQLGTTKTNRVRHIPMSSNVLNYLHNRSDHAGFVFHRSNGKPTGDFSSKVIRRICRRVGVRDNICWYTLRHTFASQLVSKGVPLPAVQQLMGHSNIGMTMRYTHLAPTTLRAAVDLLERPKSSDEIEKIERITKIKNTDWEQIIGRQWAAEKIAS